MAFVHCNNCDWEWDEDSRLENYGIKKKLAEIRDQLEFLGDDVQRYQDSLKDDGVGIKDELGQDKSKTGYEQMDNGIWGKLKKIQKRKRKKMKNRFLPVRQG